MANQFLFANFFATELTVAVGVSDTVLNIPPSASTSLQNFTSGFYAPLTLWDGSNPPEIVWCTQNPQTGQLTVLRAQESTSAFAWAAGTQVISSLTASVINAALFAYNTGLILVAGYLPLSGGTLTGSLTLAGAPTTNLMAATKAYVDTSVAPFLPLTGGVLTGNLVMSNNARIAGLLSPTVGSEPATKTYADAITTSLQNYETDNSGATATTGTATAYVLTTSSADFVSSLPNGAKVSFRAHLTSAGNCTLAVDGQPAVPLRPLIGIETVPGTIQQGGIYTATYRSATTEWLWYGAESQKYAATGGTGAAYTLTTGFSTGAPADGLLVNFLPHTANTGACTLQVDGGSALPLRAAPGLEFLANEIQPSMALTARYRATSTEWIIIGLTNTTLASLFDAAISAPSFGQVLTYNGTKWANLSASSPRGYIDGLILSNDVSNPNNVLDISAGQARAASNDFDIVLAAITKSTASFVVGTGNGAMDGGSSLTVNTLYAVWAIYNSSTGAADVLFSTNFTAPTMPGTFDKKRYIGSFRTAVATTNILAFVQVGDEFLLSAMVQTVGTFANSTANLVTLAGIPVGLKVTALVRAVAVLAGGGQTILVSTLDESDQAPTASIATFPAAGVNADLRIRTNTSGQVRQRHSTVTSATVNYNVYGWIDQRGKNA